MATQDEQPMQEMRASEQVALEIMQQLYVTGERDRLKSWLHQELTNRGWMAAMHARAMEVAEQYAATKPEQPMTAFELADKIKPFGIETFPEPIRAALMRAMLKHSRAYTQKEALQVDPQLPDPSPDSEPT